MKEPDFEKMAKVVRRKMDFMSEGDGDERIIANALRAAYQAGQKAGMEDSAVIVTQATRIPPEAVRRGTGVRDHVVLLGERLAEAIRARAAGMGGV